MAAVVGYWFPDEAGQAVLGGSHNEQIE